MFKISYPSDKTVLPLLIKLARRSAVKERDTVQQFGSLDIFVVNAGFLSFESHLHTNIRWTFFSTQAAANYMVRQNTGGSISAISSISAHFRGAQQVRNTPTKAAVLSMMQSQACALGPHGIRANALLPGTTRTQLVAVDLANHDKLKYLENRTPLGRGAEPEDMAGTAVFLASDLSKFVTGAQMTVDGGLSISLQREGLVVQGERVHNLKL